MVRPILPLCKGQIVNANICTKHQEDIDWVHHLNEISVQNQDCVLQLDYSHDTASQRKKLDTAIRDVCSKGKAVVVNNWYPPEAELSFDPESISAIRNVNEVVVWQGKQLLTYVSRAGIDFFSERFYGQSQQVQQGVVGRWKYHVYLWHKRVFGQIHWSQILQQCTQSPKWWRGSSSIYSVWISLGSYDYPYWQVLE